MDNKAVLDLPMEKNDANAKTIRDYLKTLLATVWEDEESFSGKRPFGNSGWQGDVYQALVAGGAIIGTVDEDGYATDYDRNEAAAIIQKAIRSLT